MNFSKTTGYALNVLSYMSGHSEDKFSVTELHEKLSIPYSYLRQVMGNLSKSGFIKGSTGRTGGFELVLSPEKIYLADIVDATEGLDGLNSCIIGMDVCPFDNKCAMHSIWEDIRMDILNVLKTTTLSGLMKNKL